MTSTHSEQTIVIAGGTGDLGQRLTGELVEQGARVRALVRERTSSANESLLEGLGVHIERVDFDDPSSLARACEGADCVVSTLNGLSPVMLGVQGRLLDAALVAGVARFIPSDFSLDFTRTQPGRNRNLDMRRAFKQKVDAADIQATSVLNGAFAELLNGQAPIVIKPIRRIVHWDEATQALDFTTKDDVAWYTAHVALDADAPRLLRIAGDTLSPVDLAGVMSQLTGSRFLTLRAGSTDTLSLIISVLKALNPSEQDVFPIWQGMQYMRDMFVGDGQLDPLDNARYGEHAWTSAREVLAAD